VATTPPARARLISRISWDPKTEDGIVKILGSTVIARPVENIFDFVADERNEPKYNPRMVQAEKGTPWADSQRDPMVGHHWGPGAGRGLSGCWSCDVVCVRLCRGQHLRARPRSEM
jgi:hypothetical protein